MDNQKGSFYKCTIAVEAKGRKEALQISPCFVSETITICLLFQTQTGNLSACVAKQTNFCYGQNQLNADYIIKNNVFL